MEFGEAHARVLYRLLNHKTEYTDCRCLNINNPGSPPLSREILKGEEAFIAWCRAWHGKGNCYVGRNPRNADGIVSRITTYSLDIDPEHPPRTSVDAARLAKTVMAGQSILQAWPGGYLAESGNGVLVLYRLSVPISENLEAFKRWLAGWQDEVRRYLDIRFSGEVRCDSVHDNERIIKIPGTLSVKGDRANWRLARFAVLPSVPYHSVMWPSAPVSALQKSGPGCTITLPATVKSASGPLPVEKIDDKLHVATSSLARLSQVRCDEYDSWIKVGLALSELGPIGLHLWDTWSRKSKKYQPGICEAKWQTFTKDPLITVGSLAYWAGQDSGTPQKAIPSNEASESASVFLHSVSPVDWICEPIIAARAIGFVAGLPETMKTWMMIDLSLEAALAGGGNWLGLFPVRSSKVLYVDQERFRGETQRRFKGVMGAKGIGPADTDGRLFIRCGSTTRLDLQNSYQAFRAELSRIRPNLVVVDSFVTFHTREENNRRDIQEIMEQIKALRQEFGCAIVFMDHENKGVFSDKENNEVPSAFRMAGSVAKSAAAEFVLTVRRFDHFSSNVYHTKSTLAKTVPSFTVTVKDTPEGYISVIGSR